MSGTALPAWVTIVLSLISAVIGTALSSYFQRKKEDRQYLRDRLELLFKTYRTIRNRYRRISEIVLSGSIKSSLELRELQEYKDLEELGSTAAMLTYM